MANQLRLAFRVTHHISPMIMNRICEFTLVVILVSTRSASNLLIPAAIMSSGAAPPSHFLPDSIGGNAGGRVISGE